MQRSLLRKTTPLRRVHFLSMDLRLIRVSLHSQRMRLLGQSPLYPLENREKIHSALWIGGKRIPLCSEAPRSSILIELSIEFESNSAFVSPSNRFWSDSEVSEVFNAVWRHENEFESFRNGGGVRKTGRKVGCEGFGARIWKRGVGRRDFGSVDGCELFGCVFWRFETSGSVERVPNWDRNGE